MKFVMSEETLMYSNNLNPTLDNQYSHFSDAIQIVNHPKVRHTFINQIPD